MPTNAQKTPLARTLNEFAAQKARAAIAQLGKALPAQVVAVMGPIVTVKFLIAATQNSPYTLPQVTMPIVGAEYIRMPTQIGDKGVVYPADTYIGGVSGLGGGVADLSQRGNLSTLVFFPIGNKNWSASDDPNAVVIYGPDGAIIRDMASRSVLTIDGTEISATSNGSTLTINATGISGTGVSEVIFQVGSVLFSIVGGVINFGGPTNFAGQGTGPGGVIDFGTSEIKCGSVDASGNIQSNGVNVGYNHVHTGVQTGGSDTGPPA